MNSGLIGKRVVLLTDEYKSPFGDFKKGDVCLVTDYMISKDGEAGYSLECSEDYAVCYVAERDFAIKE